MRASPALFAHQEREGEMTDMTPVDTGRRVRAEAAPRTIDRRSFLIAGAGVAAGGLLAACGGEATPTSSGTSAAIAPPAAIKTAPTVRFDPNVKAGAKPKLPRRIGWSLPAG